MWVLRELADAAVIPPSIISEKSGRTGEVPEGWRKASVTAVFTKGKKKKLKETRNPRN